MKSIISLALLGFFAATVTAQDTNSGEAKSAAFRPGQPWLDTNGVLVNAGYIWLPVEFEGEQPVIRWRDQWDLSVFPNP